MESHYMSGALGHLYFGNIEKDMRNFSDMAKELNTTTENILRYAIIHKLDRLEEVAASPEYDQELEEIKDCLEEIKEAISNIKD